MCTLLLSLLKNYMGKASVGHISMLVISILWGLIAPFSKTIFMQGYLDYISLMWLRAGGAAIAFWIASLFVKKEKVGIRDLFLLFLASLCGIVFNQGLFLKGLSMTSTTNATIITTTSPMFAMIIAAMYLKEPVTWKKVTGILVGAAGALLLILNNETDSVGGNLTGDLICLLSQISYSLYFVFFKPMTIRYSPVTMMKWIFLFATLVYIPISYNSVLSVDFRTIPLEIHLDIAFIILGGTFIAYLLIPVAQKYLRPTVGVMYNYIQPIIAVLVAIWWGLDKFSVIKGVAVLLVFAGVYLVTRSKARVPDGTVSETVS